MANYSAFFSSGLLAPQISRCATPVLPSSPMAISPSPVEPLDRQLNKTPTPLGQISSPTVAPEAHTDADRPRVRRRRSSINVAANPMALIKSPVRNAGAALQRTGIMSPTRHRAASVGMKGASEDNSLFGRLRSGSSSGPKNPSRRLRRVVRAPIPLVPPPDAPLPALPSSPTAKYGSSFLPALILGPIPRQPLLTTGDVKDAHPPRSISPTQSQGLFGSRGDILGEQTMETN